MIDQRVAQWLNEIRVLDGGFGSECQKRSHLKIDGHKAWSCRLLKDDPNLVCEIHKSFLRAGCDVISTNTYQASPRTLSEALNISVAEAKELMRHAVRLARRAVDAVIAEENLIAVPRNRKLPVLVAGSLGPYGACVGDGSEYTGAYARTMSFSDLVHFHKTRAEILTQAGVDLLAWETIPLVSEVAAICEVMRSIPNIVGWISVASADGQTTVGGDPLHEVAVEVDTCDRIFGVGVNCCIPHELIGQALANLSSTHDPCEPGTEEGYHPPPCDRRAAAHSVVTDGPPYTPKMLLVYANSGEQWVPSVRTRSGQRGHWVWPPNTGPKSWAREVGRWAMRRGTHDPDRLRSQHGKDGQSSVDLQIPRAQWIGGCCRVGPEQLIQLAEWIKPDEVYRLPNPEKPVTAAGSSSRTDHEKPIAPTMLLKTGGPSRVVRNKRKSGTSNRGDQTKRPRHPVRCPARKAHQ